VAGTASLQAKKSGDIDIKGGNIGIIGTRDVVREGRQSPPELKTASPSAATFLAAHFA
jgi:hypothetical protein